MSSFLFLAFPLVLIAYSIWRLRGIWRVAAVGCLLVALSSSVTDMRGIIKGGNLAGIYTIMLAKPVLVFLLILHGTYIATHKSGRLQNTVAKYALGALSSVLLFGGVVYFWSFSLPIWLVPVVGQLLGGLPDSVYWTVGCLLALVTAVCSIRATVKPQKTTKEQVQSSTQRLKSPVARYTIATLSSVFHFLGVLYLVYGYVPLGFPPLRQINGFKLFSVAVLLGLVASVYSFRAIVKPQTMAQPNRSVNEFAESKR